MQLVTKEEEVQFKNQELRYMMRQAKTKEDILKKLVEKNPKKRRKLSKAKSARICSETLKSIINLSTKNTRTTKMQILDKMKKSLREDKENNQNINNIRLLDSFGFSDLFSQKASDNQKIIEKMSKMKKVPQKKTEDNERTIKLLNHTSSLNLANRSVSTPVVGNSISDHIQLHQILQKKFEKKRKDSICERTTKKVSKSSKKLMSGENERERNRIRGFLEGEIKNMRKSKSGDLLQKGRKEEKHFKKSSYNPRNKYTESLKNNSHVKIGLFSQEKFKSEGESGILRFLNKSKLQKNKKRKKSGSRKNPSLKIDANNYLVTSESRLIKKSYNPIREDFKHNLNYLRQGIDVENFENFLSKSKIQDKESLKRKLFRNELESEKPKKVDVKQRVSTRYDQDINSKYF